MATLEQYDAAKEELALWQRRWENDSGNNPNKYQANIRAAQIKVASLEKVLKATGLIQRSEIEKREARIERAFPNAANKKIVTFEGVRYQRWYAPASKSRSGRTVLGWKSGWKLLDE